jgi:hypothetical protein
VTPASLEQVLTDNQAGYKEQVFYFQQGGSAHELFLVSTVDKQEPLYGYVDGVRVEQAGLGPFVIAIKRARERVTIRVRADHAGENRNDSMVNLIVVADSVEKAMKVKVATGVTDKDAIRAKVQRIEIDQLKVALSMEQYMDEVKDIPLGVKQHELLTRIIVNGEYTPVDQAALRELIRQRQAL